MDNSRWLFPDLALPLVDEHRRFFSEMNPTARPLSFRELESYNNGSFIVGWRFDLVTASRVVPLDLLLDRETPFSEPHIALADRGYFLKWPHVAKDGLLCLRQNTDTIDHNAGFLLTREFLEITRELIEDSIAGSTQHDFITEFNSYWNRCCSRKGYHHQSLLMLSAPCPPSRVVHRGVFGSNIIICDSLDDGLRWARDRFQEPSIKKDRFKPAAFIWMDFPLMPENYPRSNINVAVLAKRAGRKEYEMLANLVPESGEDMTAVLGFDSGNGPAFGALLLNDLPRNFGSKKKKDSRRFNGFRAKSFNKNVIRRRFFSADAKTEALQVQRIDRPWIFERGSRRFDKRLDEARVCLIGCGSLGAQVGKFLVQTGIKSLVLIDPDMLSWDNIGRHLLGGKDTGIFKVKGLKRYLENHFPGMLEIQIESVNWQNLFVDKGKRHLILKSDIVVSTMGNWDAEAALNHTYNTTSDFPPIIYGWTEPFGIAGHALAVTGLGGCLACGMDRYGSFKAGISKWDKRSCLKRPPACGETYQPYGVTDIAQTQAMIARLCADVITGKVIRSEHRTWVGDLSQIEEAGGRLVDEVEDYYGDIGIGYRQVAKRWKINRECLLGH